VAVGAGVGVAGRLSPATTNVKWVGSLGVLSCGVPLSGSRAGICPARGAGDASACAGAPAGTGVSGVGGDGEADVCAVRAVWVV
jgi:hypothetical protein